MKLLTSLALLLSCGLTLSAQRNGAPEGQIIFVLSNFGGLCCIFRNLQKFLKGSFFGQFPKSL